MNDIYEVIKKDLCTGCGTCIGLCPQEALQMNIDHIKGIYVPEIDISRCNKCGFCYMVCPGNSVDFKEMNLKIFKEQIEDSLIGNYLNCYIGHSKDISINKMCSSGGLVTLLLIYALEKGLIDGALVTRMNKDNPLEPEPFIARTREEILSAAKSKYCPVPLNVLLREIVKAPENQKFAVVGLPCHIQGIRKVEQFDSRLKDKIVLHLGIFCGHTPTFLGTEFILEKIICVDKKAVKELSYRGNGWPGGITVELVDGNNKFIPHHYIWGNIFSQYFYPFRCTLCCDQTAELADISFGDSWLPEFMENKDAYGHSIAIGRTKTGNQILRQMKDIKIIELNETTADKVKQSQYGLFLRRNIKTRLNFCSFLRKSVPTYNKELPFPDKYYIFKCAWFYFDIYVSSKKYLWILLPYYISVRSFVGKVVYNLKRKSNT